MQKIFALLFAQKSRQLIKGVIVMFIKNLIRLRKASKLNQQDLADKMEVSRNSITNWETGKSEPKASDIEKMAYILGVSPNEFFDDFSSQQEQKQNITDIAEEINDNDMHKFAYWSGVLDETLRVADSGNMQKIALIIPLLKSALNILLATQKRNLNQNQLNSGNSTYVNTLTSHGDNNQNIIENSVKE